MEVEEQLNKEDVIGAYKLFCPWYKDYLGKAPTLSLEELERTRQKYVPLFQQDNLPTTLPFDIPMEGRPPVVDNSVPEETIPPTTICTLQERFRPGSKGRSPPAGRFRKPEPPPM